MRHSKRSKAVSDGVLVGVDLVAEFVRVDGGHNAHEVLEQAGALVFCNDAPHWKGKNIHTNDKKE